MYHFLKQKCINKLLWPIIKIGGALKMKMPKNEDINLQKKFDDSKKAQGKNKKFYIALGICTIAVSAVAWSAYQSINTFISPLKSSNATKSDKVAKSLNSEKGKKSILNEDDNNTTSKNGKSIPYGKQKEIKSKDSESEKIQQVSASPSNLKMLYPTEGNCVLKEFSDGKPIYSNTMGDWRSHEGVDLKAEIGSKVKSIAEGVVQDVYQDSSYGTTVVISHTPGFLAYYAGLDEKNLIKKGEKINPGDTIGIIGKVPCEISEPSHLHFSVFKDSKFIDPMLMLGDKTH